MLAGKTMRFLGCFPTHRIIAAAFFFFKDFIYFMYVSTL
jgi:hypothetical protein